MENEDYISHIKNKTNSNNKFGSVNKINGILPFPRTSFGRVGDGVEELQDECEVEFLRRRERQDLVQGVDGEAGGE